MLLVVYKFRTDLFLTMLLVVYKFRTDLILTMLLVYTSLEQTYS